MVEPLQLCFNLCIYTQLEKNRKIIDHEPCDLCIIAVVSVAVVTADCFVRFV